MSTKKPPARGPIGTGAVSTRCVVCSGCVGAEMRSIALSGYTKEAQILSAASPMTWYGGVLRTICYTLLHWFQVARSEVRSSLCSTVVDYPSCHENNMSNSGRENASKQTSTEIHTSRLSPKSHSFICKPLVLLVATEEVGVDCLRWHRAPTGATKQAFWDAEVAVAVVATSARAATFILHDF